MARKKAPIAPPLPSGERVQQHLRVREFTAALALARQLYASTSSAENLALLKQAIVAAAAHFAEHNSATDFNRAMEVADQIDSHDPAWAAERACLLARGGRLADALMRADDDARPHVLAHASDRALRVQLKDFLPDDLHSGFDAVLLAFRHYETGKDDAVRSALEPIGLRSPFLEWKVLLRGLLAHAVNDDARAAENFARLDSTRLPFRLAAPYRGLVDSNWKASLTPALATEVQKHYEKLNASHLVAQLRDIAKHLGRDKPLIPVFRIAESLVQNLKVEQPQLLARLGNCLYHAILQQGQPDDLARYRKLFGNPTDDPSFYKLQALIGEQGENHEMAHAFWKKFDDWLAASPPGWPAAVLARARATVWLRMGDNADRVAELLGDGGEDLFDLLPGKFREKKPKPLQPSALDCFRKAALLAPDWSRAARDLFRALEAAEKPDEAVAAARQFLQHQPNDLQALIALGSILLGQGQATEASELFLRANSLNPLDQVVRVKCSVAVLAKARRALMDGNATEVEVIYERHRALLEEELFSATDALRSVAFLKLKKPEASAPLRERALGAPGHRLSVAYRLMVDSQLAKLKPAEKKLADAHYAAELLKLAPTPGEVARLISCYENYGLENVDYRGRKTHKTKILDLSLRTLAADALEIDFEMLANSLFWEKAWKHLKRFADSCIGRFPKNPHFLLMRSEVGLATREREYSTEQRLRRAKKLAEASSEPRHRAIIVRIDELLEQVALPQFDEMFSSFFGRG